MYRIWWFLLVFVYSIHITYAWWDFGDNDVSISLRRLDHSDNTSYLTSHALHIDLSGFGIRFSKSRGRDALDVGLYAKEDNGEGRGRNKNIASVLFPLLIGYKKATLVMGALIIVSGILLKSLLAAKTALLVTGSIALKKLFTSDHESHKIHVYPHFEESYEYTAGKSDFQGPINYHGPYSHEESTFEVAESSNIAPQYTPQYVSASSVSSLGNATTSTSQTEIKRQFYIKKKPVFVQKEKTKPVITIHRVTQND